MNYVLPEASKNRLIQCANLLKKGYTKWEKMPKKTRNIVAGVSFLATGVLLPKVLFLAAVSSVFAGKHVYLNGEVEEAIDEVLETKIPEPVLG